MSVVFGSYNLGAIAVANAPAGTYTQEMGMTLFEHFNILTQTLTAMTVTLEGTIDDVNWVDVTQDLFRDIITGLPVAFLLSNTEYIADTYMTYKNFRIKYTPTNVVNAINLQWMTKKGGGR